MAETAEVSDWRLHDPLLGVGTGLLNIDQIETYASHGLLLETFERIVGGFKPASYGLKLRGHCVLWDADGKRQDHFLSRDLRDTEAADIGLSTVSSIVLPSNSIMFVTFHPKIRLPYYVAARFNLRIRWIYAGILVGTGPLVDPGFDGYLTCPIHNLTSEPYTLLAEDGVFAWIEFTKLLQPSSEQSAQSYSGRSLDKLLQEANQGRPIRSSIPDVYAQGLKLASDSAEKAKEANESAKKTESHANRYTIGSLIALFALCVTFAIGEYNLSAQNHSLSVTGTKDYSSDRAVLQAEVQMLENRLTTDEAKLKALPVSRQGHNP